MQKLGFTVVRQKGSHIRLVKKEKDIKQLVTVPDHKVMRKGTLLNGILKPLNITLEDFKKLL